MSNLMERIQAFMDDLAHDPVEDRLVEYVVREVRNGRRLTDALHDPYVKNRLNEEKLVRVLENPEVIDAIEQAIAGAFATRDFGFVE